MQGGGGGEGAVGGGGGGGGWGGGGGGGGGRWSRMGNRPPRRPTPEDTYRQRPRRDRGSGGAGHSCWGLAEVGRENYPSLAAGLKARRYSAGVRPVCRLNARVK